MRAADNPYSTFDSDDANDYYGDDEQRWGEGGKPPPTKRPRGGPRAKCVRAKRWVAKHPCVVLALVLIAAVWGVVVVFAPELKLPILCVAGPTTYCRAAVVSEGVAPLPPTPPLPGNSTANVTAPYGDEPGAEDGDEWPTALAIAANFVPLLIAFTSMVAMVACVCTATRPSPPCCCPCCGSKRACRRKYHVPLGQDDDGDGDEYTYRPGEYDVAGTTDFFTTRSRGNLHVDDGHDAWMGGLLGPQARRGSDSGREGYRTAPLPPTDLRRKEAQEALGEARDAKTADPDGYYSAPEGTVRLTRVRSQPIPRPSNESSLAENPETTSERSDHRTSRSPSGADGPSSSAVLETPTAEAPQWVHANDPLPGSDEVSP